MFSWWECPIFNWFPLQLPVMLKWYVAIFALVFKKRLRGMKLNTTSEAIVGVLRKAPIVLVGGDLRLVSLFEIAFCCAFGYQTISAYDWGLLTAMYICELLTIGFRPHAGPTECRVVISSHHIRLSMCIICILCHPMVQRGPYVPKRLPLKKKVLYHLLHVCSCIFLK